MFKWVACLCVVMYMTLLIVGEPPERGEATAAVENIETPEVAVSTPEDAIQPAEDAVAEIEVTPAVVTPEDASAQVVSVSAPAVSVESLATDGTLAPVAEVASIAPSPVPTAQKPIAEADTATVENTSGVGEIWRVTGSTVNLRAGASTQAAVLGRTRRGESAEVMELLDNGWAKVYILETGIEAFMSAKFIERDAQ